MSAGANDDLAALLQLESLDISFLRVREDEASTMAAAPMPTDADGTSGLATVNLDLLSTLPNLRVLNLSGSFVTGQSKDVVASIYPGAGWFASLTNLKFENSVPDPSSDVWTLITLPSLRFMKLRSLTDIGREWPIEWFFEAIQASQCRIVCTTGPIDVSNDGREDALPIGTRPEADIWTALAIASQDNPEPLSRIGYVRSDGNFEPFLSPEAAAKRVAAHEERLRVFERSDPFQSDSPAPNPFAPLADPTEDPEQANLSQP